MSIPEGHIPLKPDPNRLYKSMMTHPSSPPAVHTAHLTLTVLGRRLAAQRLEPPGPQDPEQPVLVFLHEGLGSIMVWGDFPAQLVTACGLPGLLFDRLGHGRSDALPSSDVDPEYIEREAWAFLPQVLSRCGIRKSILIGHSDGGTIALMYAARYPEGVAGVITEAAHVRVEDVTRQGIRDIVSAYRRGDLKPRLQKYHDVDVDPLFYRWSDTWLSDRFAPWNVEGLLPGVRCPVLVIQGEADEFATPAQVDAIVSGVSGPAERFMVPGARHIPHHQAREAVAERMLRFIRRLV